MGRRGTRRYGPDTIAASDLAALLNWPADEGTDPNRRIGLIAIDLFELIAEARTTLEERGRGGAALAAAMLLARALHEWRISPAEFLELEEPTRGGVSVNGGLQEQQDYGEFRRTVKDAFTARGWQCSFSDEESDYLERDRLFAFCMPAEDFGPPLHVVSVHEFLTVTLRESDLTGGMVGGVEPAAIHHVYSVHAALSLVDRLLARPPLEGS